jgi:hypothetical protein
MKIACTFTLKYKVLLNKKICHHDYWAFLWLFWVRFWAI